MNLRHATSSDIVQLEQLVNSAYRGDSSRKGWTTEADLLDGVRTSAASLSKMLANTSAVILVLENGSGIIGCVYLEQKGEALYLGMLTVKPELQASGIGAKLMQAAEEQAIALGCDRIRMTVITVRESLIAYYKRKGFVETGEREPFPNDPAFGIPKQPLEFLVMEKRLSQAR